MPERNRVDLLQGTLDFIVLQTLRWGPQHGYGISQAINAASREALKAETGTLYPALHRLEERGWIVSEWKTSDNKQRANFYKLTAAGRKRLASEQSRWLQLVEAMAALMSVRDHEA
jgi:PadR family transcriptional regulator PadR